MVDRPIFSIITPVYNREKNIGIAIESVLRQSDSCWELVLVDDGSTDRTYAVCMNYVHQDCRVRCFRQENRGVASARNVGLAQARGQYVLFLDSDDTVTDDALDVLHAYITAYADVDMLCFGTRHVAECWTRNCGYKEKKIEKKEIRERYIPTHINIYPQNEHFLLNFVWNKCYSMSFLRKHQLLFDEQRRTWEDGLFVVNCLDHAQSILLIPEILHQGCDDPTVEHLSAMVFETQLPFYIQDEKEFKLRYEQEYDFENEHYCHSNFCVINMLFSRLISTYGKASKKTIKFVLEEPIVVFWAEHIVPLNETEKRIQRAIRDKRVGQIYRVYKPSVYKRAARKLVHFVRKLQGYKNKKCNGRK